LNDLWSFTGFKVQTMWEYLRHSVLPLFLPFLGIPLLYFTFHRLFKRKGKRREISEVQDSRSDFTPAGVDSEFFMIEEKLSEAGFKRFPSETLTHWVNEMKQQHFSSTALAELEDMMDLHYSYRFDPKGISDKTRRALKSGVDSWLQRFPDK